MTTQKNPEKQTELLSNDEEEKKYSDQEDESASYDYDTAPIVIDNGSYGVFAGYGGDDLPVYGSISVLGTLRDKHMTHNNIEDKAESFVANDAFRKRGILSLNYPMVRGIVTNWDGMEKIWQALFCDMSISSLDHPVLINEHPLTPKNMKEKSIQIMFEKFKVPKYYVAISSVLSLYASGRRTGIVLESGFGATHAVPIYEGYCLSHATLRLELAGLDINNYLIRELKNNMDYVSVFGSSSDPSTSERECVTDLKETLCYISMDYDGLINSNKLEAALFALPDGNVIEINEERFRATELMFKPFLCGLEDDGIHSMISKSIMKCDVDIRKDLWDNVVIAGGNTMLKGFKERLEKELKPFIPDSYNLKLIAPPERNYSSWIGGSILASLSTFQEMWVSKEVYNECGASVVHRYCT